MKESMVNPGVGAFEKREQIIGADENYSKKVYKPISLIGCVIGHHL